MSVTFLTNEDKLKLDQDISKLSEDIADLKENGTGGGVVVSSVEPETDDIPKVFFSEAIPQTKDDATTAFRYISKTKDISGYAEFKAQGNSSMSYPKKNMTVKMYSDEELSEKLKVDFKEWGKQAKHVYKANWIDLTHARNIVSARLWADVVKSRENYLELPELLRTSPNQGAVDGFPVKVYSKGIYQGRYTLNIPKDAWMANMDDALDNHCILCGENYASGCFRATASINGGDWSDEVHETVPHSIKTRWNEVISFVMNSTDEEFVANLENYFFVDSLIDYFVFGMVSCGLDAFGKNQLYFTYDGIKWIASMYDMDSTWGLFYNGGKFVPASYSRTEYEDFVGERTGNLLYIRLAELFYDKIQTRYAELKNGALSVANIIDRFERFTDIASLDLVKEDYASTTGGGKFTGIPSKDTNNIQQIRQFVIDRYSYCDEYIASLVPTEPDIPVEPDVPEEPEEPTPDIPEDGTPNLLYELPEETVFDGSSTYIDTGIQLAKEDKDFTILLKTTCYDFVNYDTLVYCGNEGPGYPGYTFRGDGGGSTVAYGKIVKNSNIPAYPIDSVAVVITHKSNSNSVITKSRYLGKSGVDELNDYTWKSVDDTLMIGCYKKTDGTKGRFWKGTLHDFKVYDQVLTDNEISEYLVSIDSSSTYELPEPTTFDGVDDYIDTGIRLFDTEKDFTLFFHADTTQQTTGDWLPVFYCQNEVMGYPGLQYVIVSGAYQFRGNAADSNIQYTETTNAPNASVKSCIVCQNGVITRIVNQVGSDSEAVDLTVNANNFVRITQTILLGCAQTTNGTKRRFWKGTIYDFKVYDRVLSDDEITALFA